MTRLYLTVEGQTEQAFAVQVLKPHLSRHGVYVSKPRLTGPNSRRGGHIPRGGMFNRFQQVIEDIRRWLKEDKSSDARFSMMVDLYGLPSDFPGYDQGMSHSLPIEQARFLQESLVQELNDARFIPYLQVHEFEALVLAEPIKLADLYEPRANKLESLCRECAQFTSPEDIDHGQHSHPKSRIQQCIPEYDENVAGPLITESIGLEILRSRCPNFGEWLARLESLAH